MGVADGFFVGILSSYPRTAGTQVERMARDASVSRRSIRRGHPPRRRTRARNRDRRRLRTLAEQLQERTQDMSNEEHLASIDAALNALGIFAKQIAERLDDLPTGRELLMGLVLAAHVKHDGLV